MTVTTLYRAYVNDGKYENSNTCNPQAKKMFNWFFNSACILMCRGLMTPEEMQPFNDAMLYKAWKINDIESVCNSFEKFITDIGHIDLVKTINGECAKC